MSIRPRSLLAGAAALAAALLLSFPAGTTTKAFITLKVGDEPDVVGTSILCLGSKGSSGRLGIVCFRSNAKGAIPGPYFAGIGQDGRVLAGLTDAKGAPKISYQRTLTAAGGTTAATVRRQGKVGQVFPFADTTSTTSDCARDDQVEPLPGTYAVIVSDQVASAGKIAKTRSTTTIWAKQQPKG